MSSGPPYPPNPPQGSSASGQQQGFGSWPSQQQWGGDPYAPYAAYANAPAAAIPQPQAGPTSFYGDGANEYLSMKRGRYNAWVYVVFGFLMEIGFLGLIPGLIIGLIAGAVGMDADTTGIVSVGVGLATGTVGAYFVFRDRWRCIEAFSSRFCAGIMNISLLYVPIIAFVYANVRGVQKFAGK